ncbi:454_t:CDS:1 [Racocetra persica]|uniref:454_t:CDS:1 n=1 Tax=Racocetra persica TaxID=160502 RepID=A0ACA9RIU2_9GLOM|nr:454_t:CDS:1 [Racocetra persica]
MSTAKDHHPIWQQYTKNDDGSLSCLKCPNKYKKVPAVTTLKNHYIQKHNDIWKKIRSKSKGGGHKKKYKRQKHRDSSFKPPKAFKAIKTSDQNSEMEVDSENQCISESANSKENIDVHVIIDDEETIQSNLQNLVLGDNEINEISQDDNLSRDSANKTEIDATDAVADFNDAGKLKRLQGKFKMSY